MSIYAPLHHAVFAFGAAQGRSCPVSGQASARVGNWPDPMRRLGRVGNWPDPMRPRRGSRRPAAT
jgi:hypothetical protein